MESDELNIDCSAPEKEYKDNPINKSIDKKINQNESVIEYEFRYGRPLLHAYDGTHASDNWQPSVRSAN